MALKTVGNSAAYSVAYLVDSMVESMAVDWAGWKAVYWAAKTVDY